MNHWELSPRECRAVVYARCMGWCELCGKPLHGDWEAHHRLARSHGGLWCPCTIIGLHPRCHTQGPSAVHDLPEVAMGTGHIVLSGSDPWAVPLVLPWPFLLPEVRLSCGGTYT